MYFVVGFFIVILLFLIYIFSHAVVWTLDFQQITLDIGISLFIFYYSWVCLIFVCAVDKSWGPSYGSEFHWSRSLLYLKTSLPKIVAQALGFWFYFGILNASFSKYLSLLYFGCVSDHFIRKCLHLVLCDIWYCSNSFPYVFHCVPFFKDYLHISASFLVLL